MRRFTTASLVLLATLCVAGPAVASIGEGTQARALPATGTVTVTYERPADLARALERHPAVVVRRIPALGVASLRPAGSLTGYAARLAAEPGIVRVERSSPRRSLVEPALLAVPGSGSPQWQYAATGTDRVPADVLAAAASVTIAVIDTGADVAAPDLAAKRPATWSVRRGGPDVADANGHGTFVAALAAGSGSNGEGIAGAGGDARLLVVQAGAPNGSFTDVDEAAAIVYAVDHGARILNLSLGGVSTSTAERRAVDYAVAKGALLVAAVGNGRKTGNAVEYPAALLQPVGSRGVGGHGLAVAASTRAGTSAAFSSTGTHVSLAAPGENVFSAVSAASPDRRYPRTPLPGSIAGLYGVSSGTSFAAPQVAGAAALVWAAAPGLSAAEVATILEETASGGGAWTPELGFGVVDVAAAVARARGATPVAAPAPARARLSLAARRSVVDVRLRVAGAPGAAAGRTVLLETLANGRWSAVGRAVTDGSGRAVWRHALSPGSHRVRAHYPGTADVAAATSPPVRVVR